MKTTIKALRGRRIDRLLVESVDLSLYIAHAEIAGERLLIVEPNGRPLKTHNLLDMKTALARLDAAALVMIQRSAYDEMVGQTFAPADNSMELPLAPGFEALPPWQH